MFTKLFLENFRAFEKETVELNKINLFFGPNNSGKSSLISGLNLITQTVQSADIGVDILLSGKFEDFGTYYDMVHGNDVSKNISLGIGAELKIPQRHFELSSRGGRLLRIKEKKEIGYLEIKLGYRKNRHEILLLSTEIQMPKEKISIRTKRNQFGRHLIDSINGLENLSSVEMNQMISVRNLLPNLFLIGGLSMKHVSYEKIRTLREFIRKLREQINRVEFVGPFRSTPQRLYSITGESPSKVGRHGERALEIMMQDAKKRGKEKRDLLSLVSNWLEKAEISRNIYTQSMMDRYFEVMIRNYYTGEDENLSDVGFGCSQIIPVLIAGFNVGEGGTFIVQEPEIHLHPKAQAELGSFVNALYKRNVQLIVETHSEHLLLRVQSHIAKGDIKAKDVNVFYIDPEGKKQKKKQKEIVKIDIGEDGFFTTKWPKGFFPERLQEAEKLAGLLVERR
jgi:predicted ATPase